mgnify:CR=1 FL=1
MDIFLLTVSAVLIVLGSYLASSVAEALQFQYNDAFIAGFIALLQTLPEYAFVILLTLSAEQYAYEYALVSIIGANIMLIALGFPVIMLIAILAKCRGVWEDKALDLMRENSLEAVFLALSGAYMVFIGLKGYIDAIDSVVLLGMFIVYIYIITHLPPEVETEEPHRLARFFMNRKKLSFAAIIIGALVIWYAAEVFTEGILEYAKNFVLSGIVLAGILMPLVSELPEKLTAYIGATRNEDMARLGVTNFISSRINNGTLLIASMFLTAFIAHGATQVVVNTPDFPFLGRLMVMAGILSILGAFTTVDRRITVVESILLFALYVGLILALLDPKYLVYMDILMVLLAIAILFDAIITKRMYWIGDIKYTLSLLRRAKK